MFGGSVSLRRELRRTHPGLREVRARLQGRRIQHRLGGAGRQAQLRCRNAAQSRARTAQFERRWHAVRGPGALLHAAQRSAGADRRTARTGESPELRAVHRQRGARRELRPRGDAALAAGRLTTAGPARRRARDALHRLCIQRTRSRRSRAGACAAVPIRPRDRVHPPARLVCARGFRRPRRLLLRRVARRTGTGTRPDASQVRDSPGIAGARKSGCEISSTGTIRSAVSSSPTSPRTGCRRVTCRRGIRATLVLQ